MSQYVPLISLSVVSSSGEKVAVTESLNRDFHRVSMWCDLRGMKFNVISTIEI